MRINLEIPGLAGPTSLDVESNERVLVGRAPAPSAGSPAARTVEVPSLSVSANHVSFQRSMRVLTVTDERSRNGTWLRLPPGEPVHLETDQPLFVRLGATSEREPASMGPADAVWTSATDYHDGVKAAITRWFEQLGVPVRVDTVPHSEGAAHEPPSQIPLPNGFDVSIVPLRTMDHRWESLLSVLWAYVTAQNMIFTSEEHTRDEGMVLVSAAIRRVHRSVVEAAQRGLRVHLFGPSGSGKDGLARCYHRNSGRPGTFVGKNCAILSREFLRMELFGAEKGSYTGAVRSITGAVERAHGGTLFLDEIGEMPADVQAMLLTFLDSGEYERFGADGQVRKADVRVISATNRDLRGAVAARTFREDLWYRVAGQVIEVPSLGERPDDVEAYLRMSVLPSGVSAYEALAPAARDRLMEHRFPGNFRELRSFVDQLPPGARPGSVSVDACHATLLRISSAPPSLVSPGVRREGGLLELARLAEQAGDAFRSDAGHVVRCWDDVKQYVESYLKPLIFASLSGMDAGEGKSGRDIAAIAQSIEADRGTVRKQLARYLERFGGG